VAQKPLPLEPHINKGTNDALCYLSQAGAKSQTKEGLKVIGGNDRCNILLRNKPAAHLFPPEAVFKKGQGNAR
jgi:hypothetical protein